MFFLVEFIDPSIIPMDLILKNSHDAISNLIFNDDLLELLVVAENKEDA